MLGADDRDMKIGSFAFSTTKTISPTSSYMLIATGFVSSGQEGVGCPDLDSCFGR